MAAGALWFVLAITVAAVARNRAPDTALAWWPYDSGARAHSAYRLLQSDMSSASRLRARRLAEVALAREPINVAAARTLGLIATLDGDAARSHALMEYAESLSRRDVPTQLWLIEDEVRQNDIVGALRHYDRALRVSEDARAILFPVLVQASSDPHIARPLAQLLDRRPSWWLTFGETLAAESRSPETLAFLIQRLHLDPDNERERDMAVRAMGRLVQLGAYPQAERIYATLTGSAPASRSYVHDGGFEKSESGLPPFDWLFTSEPGLAAFREPVSQGRQGHALIVVAENGRNGEVARQLLVLAPGLYQLTGRSGGGERDPLVRPQLGLRCASSRGAGLLVATVPSARDGASFRYPIDVPRRGCRAQWLTITARSGFDNQASRPWIDELRVEPR